MDLLARQVLCRGCFTKVSTLRSACNARTLHLFKFGTGRPQIAVQSGLVNGLFRFPQFQNQRGKLVQSLRRFASESAPPKRDVKPKPASPITWKSAVFFAGVGIIAYMGYLYVKKEKEAKIAKERSRSVGKAALGGPWELIDHDGVKRKSSDYLGQWIILYFGFTHCPDVCPEELDKLVEVVDTIDKMHDVPNLKPLFITVDPDRDTGPVIKEYCEEFSPKLLGFTGAKEKIDEATKAYRVYYSLGPKDEDGDYIVDHSIIVYLVNPEGNFVDYYGQNKTAQEVINSITIHMHKYQQYPRKGLIK